MVSHIKDENVTSAKDSVKIVFPPGLQAGEERRHSDEQTHINPPGRSEKLEFSDWRTCHFLMDFLLS